MNLIFLEKCYKPFSIIDNEILAIKQFINFKNDKSHQNYIFVKCHFKTTVNKNIVNKINLFDL